MNDKAASGSFESLQTSYSSYPFFCTIPNAFDTEQCLQIIDAHSRSTRKAEHQINNSDTGQKIRHADVFWLARDKNTDWIFNRLVTILEKVNTSQFHYDLDGTPFDLQLVRYRTGQTHAWHADFGHEGLSRRKLSASVQLSASSDYSGGGLELMTNNGVQSASADQGSMTVFGSWVMHRAVELKGGERWALVVWATGTPFH